MTKPRHAVLFASITFLLLILGTTALAQSNKGTVLGTVKDPNDALVANAKVTVTNIGTGESREVTTGDEGSYTVSNLEPGNTASPWKLLVSKQWSLKMWSLRRAHGYRST